MKDQSARSHFSTLASTSPPASAPILPPVFSPMLFAGIALRPVPVAAFSPLVKYILGRIEQLYPEVFQRLAPLGSCRFLIVPTDFHTCFLLSLNDGSASVEVIKKEGGLPGVDTTISGSLLSLVQLLEGSVDGDALFFSREINVHGDTEALLTLRNAVDSADISFEEVLVGRLAFLKPVFDRAIAKAARLYQVAQKDFQLVHKSLVDPIVFRMSQVDDDLDRQEARMIKIEKDLRKMKTFRRKTANTVGD